MEINPKSIARNKLILLYLLKQMNHKLSEQQLLRINAENQWMDYFDLSASLSEMTENHLLQCSQSINGTFYAISEIGKTTLEFFEKELYASMRSKIDDLVEKNRSQCVLETQLYADYVQVGENQYRVTLKILEQNLSIFELSLIASSKNEADIYARNWKENAMRIYQQTYGLLLSNLS